MEAVAALTPFTGSVDLERLQTIASLFVTFRYVIRDLFVHRWSSGKKTTRMRPSNIDSDGHRLLKNGYGPSPDDSDHGQQALNERV